MTYPQHVVGWMADILEATEWRMRPLDILDTEERYPGLMDDIATEVWQRGLVKKQINPQD